MGLPPAERLILETDGSSDAVPAKSALIGSVTPTLEADLINAAYKARVRGRISISCGRQHRSRGLHASQG
jgi:hypothetical protein